MVGKNFVAKQSTTNVFQVGLGLQARAGLPVEVVAAEGSRVYPDLDWEEMAHRPAAGGWAACGRRSCGGVTSVHPDIP